MIYLSKILTCPFCLLNLTREGVIAKRLFCTKTPDHYFTIDEKTSTMAYKDYKMFIDFQQNTFKFDQFNGSMLFLNTPSSKMSSINYSLDKFSIYDGKTHELNIENIKILFDSSMIRYKKLSPLM